jgi:hypothetical protein
MSFLDLSFDAQLEARPTLPWLPWVGSGYRTSDVRTLVVGESVYDWSESELQRKAFKERYERRDALRRTHTNHAMNFRLDSPYVRNIERAVHGSTTPEDTLRHGLWASVVYHNLVLEVLKTGKHRPGKKQFAKGWVEALDLCELLEVEQLLVYGVGSADALKKAATARGMDCRIRKLRPEINRCFPRIGTLETGNAKLRLLFIRHPSAFFSWDQWAPVIREHLSLAHITGQAPAATELSATPLQR